jgi:glycerate 2-kinase
MWLVAAGKAAPPMASAVARLAGKRLRGGLVVSPASSGVAPGLEVFQGGHPVPTTGSEAAGRRALAVAQQVGADEALLVLLSGGASALMAVPAIGLTLEDKRQTTEILLRAGADIGALNTVRKHLSAVKGGWLAAAAPAGCRTLAVSDVVGDDPSVIGSGPTVADASTFEDALDALNRFGGAGAYPVPVVACLRAGARGERPETPGPGDGRLARAETFVIGTRRDAMRGAAEEADRRGYGVLVLDDPILGEAREAARAHGARIEALAAASSRPLCVVSSGETTVRVTGSGRGGRNQEFALAASDPLRRLAPAAAASLGTDGIDGPTDAAGAIVDSETLDRARRAGLASPSDFLRDNNSYPFFDALDDLIRTGPTGTNVGDLQVFLLA